MEICKRSFRLCVATFFFQVIITVILFRFVFCFLFAYD